MAVANLSFLSLEEVYHPTNEDAVAFGMLSIDVQSLMKPTSSESQKFTNNAYFQADSTPRPELEEEIAQGSWSEVDGGLVSLQGKSLFKPVQPPEHPDISFSRWSSYALSRAFGAVNDRTLDGAPVVGCDTGHVQCFFPIASGYIARCATLDDLRAEGWAMV